MVRNASGRRVNFHHTLLTDAWTADVKTLEEGVGKFAIPPAHEYHVSLFELKDDSQLHVNVTHKEETRSVKGWSGPGVSANGFVHNRRFESAPIAEILRSIRQMVFAARA